MSVYEQCCVIAVSSGTIAAGLWTGLRFRERPLYHTNQRSHVLR